MNTHKTPYQQFYDRNGGHPAFREPGKPADAYPALIACEAFAGDRVSVPFSIVLRDMGPTAAHRYVTHCRSDADQSHYWGQYFANENEARIDFSVRCAKYRREFA